MLIRALSGDVAEAEGVRDKDVLPGLPEALALVGNDRLELSTERPPSWVLRLSVADEDAGGLLMGALMLVER